MNARDVALLERMHIRERVALYVDAINHRDWAVYADCWVEDSSFQMIYDSEPAETASEMTSTTRPVNLRAIGRPAILDLVSGYNRNPWLVQLPHAVVVELQTPDLALARQTMTVHSYAMNLVGMCYDRFRRCADGEWRFVDRDYRPTYFEPTSPPGLVTRRLPAANYRQLPEHPGSGAHS